MAQGKSGFGYRVIPCAMFTLLIDRKHQVLLTRFSGTLRHEVLLAQAVAARTIAAREGPTRALLDFSAVKMIDMSVETAKEMGSRQQNIANQVRVYVIPNRDQFAGARMFGTYQDIFGNIAPHIVRTMIEAYSFLKITDPDFQPLEIDPQAI
jgi:hypothetical protein